jgi:8-oxo-dGTP diphosphatase
MRDFVFCPFCGTRFEKKEGRKGPRNHCPICGFTQYKNPVPSVGAIPVKNGKVLLIKRGVAPAKGAWVFPTGFIDEGESPPQACLRELREETGLEGKIVRIIEAYAEEADIYGSILVIMYLVKVTGGKLQPGDDAADAGFFKPTELPDLLFDCFKDSIARALKEGFL